MNTKKKATIYRMVMPEHVCPFGMKSVHLLKKHGYEIEDHHLKKRKETDAFKEKYDVETTPQIFIDEKRIGGYDELQFFLGEKKEKANAKSYRPVLAVFAVAFLLALAMYAVNFSETSNIFTIIPDFAAITMALLALQKLQDVESFSTMFLNYDLAARKWVPYAFFYPYAELVAGVLMLAGFLPFVSAPLAFVIGLVGTISVFKAVYVDKRELKCACVGGNNNVPLGFVSLTENLTMVAMGVWVIANIFV